MLSTCYHRFIWKVVDQKRRKHRVWHWLADFWDISSIEEFQSRLIIETPVCLIAFSKVFKIIRYVFYHFVLTFKLLSLTIQNYQKLRAELPGSILKKTIPLWSTSQDTRLPNGKAVVRIWNSMNVVSQRIWMWSGTHSLRQKLWIINLLCPTQKWAVRI